jgi:hypothetical protein
LSHGLAGVASVRNIYIVEVKSDQTGVQNLGLHPGIFGLELGKELAQWQRCWPILAVLAGEGAGTRKIEHFEVALGSLGSRGHGCNKQHVNFLCGKVLISNRLIIVGVIAMKRKMRAWVRDLGDKKVHQRVFR